ncbi:MAG TPA: 30S ribosomal protein S8 [Candidatus Paceibacterota bacterium]|nr:30S ribosomal protein S8 [Candidatus Paceibacterota bacterium]HMP19185.1 30S ribosomal protein S8 [Candidatus Paceibacterota bacterium]HMP85284.1 30S ribosomal protein S8 [Candidatus Paceibacterota bacterium]
MVGDSISNLINGLKIASIAKKDSVSISSSKMIENVLNTLKKSGFISDFKVSGEKKKTVKIDLLYVDGEPKIKGVKRVSKYSKRIYKKTKELRPVKSNYGVSIMTTQKGIMTGAEAKKANIGGEILFEIW